ncbi:MAG TPA: 50S ribosomal protein L22 [Chloroflexota bacterium]|nr:50S ribosomal protein L22 [Chloroflexota bacterium]
MEVRAVAKNIRRSPQKVRLVADVVRGMTVREALSALKLMPQGAAEDVYKVVKSAAANAENNFEMDGDNLYLHRIYVDEGPTLKRYRARSHGRPAPRLRRSSHITAVVDEKGAR